MMFKKVFAKFGSGAKAFLIYKINDNTSKSIFLHRFAFFLLFSGSPPEGQGKAFTFSRQIAYLLSP